MPLPMDDSLSLPVALMWIRLNAVRIFLGGVVFALLAAPIAFFMPKSYRSEVTLFVSPPVFKDDSPVTSGRTSTVKQDSIAELMPPALPMEAYKVVALSAPVLKEVIVRIPLHNTRIQSLRNLLQVELIRLDTRGTQGPTYTQTLVFRTSAASADLAAKIAETWSEVFKEQVDSVATERMRRTSSLLEALHNATRAALEQANSALADHQKAWNLELIKAQLDARQKQMTEFEALLKQTEVDLAWGERKQEALRAERAKESPKDVYFRAPSDDAYWIAGAQGGAVKMTPDKGLRTEEANKTYLAIRTEEVRVNQETEGLKATKDMLLLKLDDLRKEIDALTVTLAEKTLERDKFILESDSLKTSYALVRTEYEKSRMAEQAQASDIVIAGKAIAPYAPSSASPAKIILLAGLIGMCATGGFLLLKAVSEMALLPEGVGLAAALLPHVYGADRDKAPPRREE
ncbi:MAG TPA: hypothetical protein PKZ01_00390 [Candidatus Hydrogenedentes bacterium]|nr:hypothetical protein [Candidatus Hydrogenedentota bacterium]